MLSSIGESELSQVSSVHPKCKAFKTSGEVYDDGRLKSGKKVFDGGESFWWS